MERIRIEPTSRADVGDIIRHESGQTSVTTLGRQSNRMLSNGDSLQLTFRTFKRRKANERKTRHRVRLLTINKHFGTRIDWTKAELAVRKLQARIVKAQKEGRYNKVKALQWTLTHSFYAKALAVKRVTSNGGGNTPGVGHANHGRNPKQKHKR